MTSLAMLLAAANPVVSMFPQNVTFHAGFDDGTVEAAVGMTPDHPRSWKNYVLCDGLFGKALSRGMVDYQQRPEQPIVDGERPGSVVLWLRLNAEQQPRTRGLAKWETCAARPFPWESWRTGSPEARWRTERPWPSI